MLQLQITHQQLCVHIAATKRTSSDEPPLLHKHSRPYFPYCENSVWDTSWNYEGLLLENSLIMAR